MNGLALLGILLLIYAVFIVFVTIKKPDAIWNMSKIRGFKKVLGEKGTVIFFYVWALLAATVGIWLLTK